MRFRTKRPYDPRRPVVCLDQTGKPLTARSAPPSRRPPGQVAHHDCEYVRNGVANLFVICEPLAGQRLAKRFRCHYTPKHGSWLDRAEIELGILSRLCLSQRIESIDALCRQTRIEEEHRDAAKLKIHWQFTTAYVRTKLKKPCPSLEE